jgi:hypothetical protein
MSTVLARCAARLRRLRPDWGNPSRYFEERDELARAIELEAAGRCQNVAPPSFHRAPQPVPDERTRHLVALATFQADEIDRLRRMLAQARPRAQPRRAPDARQLALDFATDAAERTA